MSGARIRTAMVQGLHRVYQWTIKPLLAATNPVAGGQRCRYYPTCSKYAVDAVASMGVLRGGWLALRRVGRCHPWAPGGVDLVPTRETYRWWGIADGAAGEHEHAATPRVTTKDSALRGA